MKPSRQMSRVNVELVSNVPETVSVSTIRGCVCTLCCLSQFGSLGSGMRTVRGRKYSRRVDESEKSREKWKTIQCGEKQHRFPGFARSSFWQGYYENEDVRIVRNSSLRQGHRILILWINELYNLEKKLVLTVKGLNFVEFRSGGLPEKHAVVTWNLRIISAFA
jgi:hypothetical protein